MKRVFGFVLFLILTIGLVDSASAVDTKASCAILMDADSGRILYAQNIHEQRLIASITKLMTALVAAEQTADLDEEFTVPPECVGIEGSSIYLQTNEKVTMRGLLYGLLLQSGNDAAAAIACRVAGDVDSFAKLMNQRAQELGMQNSHFTNPSGLNDDGHYSTAYDMALLACVCLENEVVAEICAAKSATIGTRTFVNHNKLLYRYEGCVGMKTGYTELAGRTLVSAARRNGQTLICVTLNDRDDWNDHEALFDYGFAQYPNRVLCTQGENFGAVPVTGSLLPSLPVIAAETVRYPLREEETLKLTVEIAHGLQAPVAKEMSVGWAIWSLDGETVAETELICGNAARYDFIDRPSVRERIFRWLDRTTLAPNGAHLI